MISYAEPHDKGDSFVKSVYVRRAIQAIDTAEAEDDHGEP